jgi:uncharacterized protein YbbK (DUF523 family)
MERKEKVLVSACLLGQSCAYDGEHRKSDAVCRLAEKYELIPICPECEGGLPTPRIPSERVGERVLSKNGTDVTRAYAAGAKAALSLALGEGVAFAVLKSKSPSCGKGEIYDGSFTHTLILGNGVTAELLLSRGIPVYTEKEIQ